MTAPYPALVEGSRVARLIAQAVEREREACAKECKALADLIPESSALHSRFTASACAARIRARGSAA